jgi:hypothetical protein
VVCHHEIFCKGPCLESKMTSYKGKDMSYSSHKFRREVLSKHHLGYNHMK